MSHSSTTALRWAALAAAHRTGGSDDPSGVLVGAGDVLVGVLLAHPDPDGEARVLLQHFGLTARDVLPPDYPAVSADDLRRMTRQVDSEKSPTGGEVTAIISSAQELAGGAEVHLRHLLGGLLLDPESELVTGWETALPRAGSGLSTVRESYRRWLQIDDSGVGRAGSRLRIWLARENRQSPVEMPGYASDGIDEARDLIGIRTEADALAYLIASRDVRPPLAIGLFGDWGSGKSFLMRSVKRRIRVLGEMVADQAQHEVPVWRNIKQIEFNAWEYVEGNLWAGLLERIFRELGTMPAAGIVEARRGPVLADLAAQTGIVGKADQNLVPLRTQRIVCAQELAQAEAKAEQVTQAAEQQVRADAGVRGPALDALRRAWVEQRVKLVGASSADLLDALAAARAELLRGRALLGPYWTVPRILLLSLGVLLVPLVALGLSVLDVSPVVTVLGGLAPLVPLVTATLRGGTRWTGAVLTEIESAEADVRKATEERVAVARQQVDEAQRKLTDVEQHLADTTAMKQQALDKQAELDATLATLTPARILVDFADKRSSDYRSRLGLLSTVRRDLEQLQDEVISNNQEVISNNQVAVAGGAAGTATDVPHRIVLYIDDLDRCPPAKVVEVLEAVHLLLAFELFVVVVAVDSRWLSTALTDQLVALRPTDAGGDHPTPQNYLEKIFQLPFWVRSLPEPARVQLLHGLLAGSVRTADQEEDQIARPDLTVGEREEELLAAMLSQSCSELRLTTSPLALSAADLEFIESLAPLLGDTPRGVKRFVNTCQLLLALPPQLAADAQRPGGREIVCFLAAVSEGLPALAGALFTGIRGKPTTTLSSWTDSHKADPLTAWLGKRPLWADLPLDRLDVRLDMVDRLSFLPPRLATGDRTPQHRN